MQDVHNAWQNVCAAPGDRSREIAAKRFADTLGQGITAHAADIAAGQGIESLGKAGKGR